MADKAARGRQTERNDVIVTDTSPLIALALGEGLRTLTAPGIRVVIPDAVWVEATRVEGAPGASELLEWLGRNDDVVRTRPTEIGLDQLQRIREGRSIRGMGEKAADEVLETTARQQPSRTMFLLFEDTDLKKRTVILPPTAFALSTGDWLRSLQKNRLIQSADEVLDQATLRGRTLDLERTQRSKAEALAEVDRSLKAAARRDGRG